MVNLPRHCIYKFLDRTEKVSCSPPGVERSPQLVICRAPTHAAAACAGRWKRKFRVFSPTKAATHGPKPSVPQRGGRECRASTNFEYFRWMWEIRSSSYVFSRNTALEECCAAQTLVTGSAKGPSPFLYIVRDQSMSRERVLSTG